MLDRDESILESVEGETADDRAGEQSGDVDGISRNDDVNSQQVKAACNVGLK